MAAPPANDLCTGALPALTRGVPVTATNEGAFDNYFGVELADMYGPEVVFTYTPTASGPFKVTLVSHGADLSLWMTEGLCGDPRSCLVFDDSGGGSGGVDSILWSTGRAGSTYFIVVDALLPNSTGPFELAVH